MEDFENRNQAVLDGGGAPGSTAKRQQASGSTGKARDETEAGDPLLGCLEIVARLLDRPMSKGGLVAGLPLGRSERLDLNMALAAAARAGLHARLARRALSTLDLELMPCILLLEGGDACVLIRRDCRDSYVIARPDTGMGEVVAKAEAIERRHTGQVLFVKPRLSLQGPTSDGSDGDNHWFWSALSGSWRTYGDVAIAALLINLFALAGPIFVMTVYDRVVPNHAVETLWALAIGAAIVFLFDFLLRNLRSCFLEGAGQSADQQLAARIFGRITSLPLAQRPSSAGGFASHLRDFESLRDFLTAASLAALIDLPFVVIFLVVMWQIGGAIILAPALAILLVLGASWALHLPLARLARRSCQEQALRHGLLIEALCGLETVKALAAEGRFQQRYHRMVTANSVSSAQTRLVAAMGVNLAILAQNLVATAVVILGVYRIKNGDMTIGSLVACTILAGRAMAPLAQIAQTLVRWQHARSAYRAIDHFMALPSERPVARTFLHRQALEGRVEFVDVSFAYPNQGAKTLDRVSFAISPGERVGVIGRAGSGKTTLGRLLLDLYRPDNGLILVDGVDHRQIDPVDLRRNIGAMLQDLVLFQGSLRDNLLFGCSALDDAAMARAMSIADLNPVAFGHPLGLDRPIGERGEGLSGGQKQAVALARALINDPPILLLDEPTSAMDNQAELRLKHQLGRVLLGKTLLLITHRTSLLSLVDRVIVLERGRIAADGPRNRVLAALAAGQIPSPA